MPARKKTGGLRSPMSDDNDKDSEAYILKRKRNNDVSELFYIVIANKFVCHSPQVENCMNRFLFK